VIKKIIINTISQYKHTASNIGALFPSVKHYTIQIQMLSASRAWGIKRK